jgi:NAD(P)-dependent dehydrogenase (short-subunit alcohol dehydrogenase family)
MACKHVLPIMRQQRTGAIINISSTAAWEDYPLVTYKATKAATIAYTKQVAMQNAEYGVRANVILPGMMDTPMAVDTRARVSGKSRAEVAAMRDAKVPLPATGWAPHWMSPMPHCSSPSANKLAWCYAHGRRKSFANSMSAFENCNVGRQRPGWAQSGLKVSSRLCPQSG